MKQSIRSTRVQHGQTLIIALLILGVLLILGAVFAGILSRTIKNTTVAKQRGLNNDYAEAGIRFAHGQLVNSELGADWFGLPTIMTQVAANTTRDPDAYYLRPQAAGLNYPGTTRVDQGGPDGLGPFFRVDYRQGRALVRVRYAPGDPSTYSDARVGGLREPGLARNYLIIESIGRQGEIRPNDPSLSSARGSVQFQGFGTQVQFDTEFAKIKAFDEREITSRKLIAFAQIGLIDYGRWVTNKYRSTRPIEIGMPTQLGARYRENSATVGLDIDPPVEVGGTLPTFNQTNSGPGALAGFLPASGSMRFNGSVRIHGTVIANLNKAQGDKIITSGNFLRADNRSNLLLNVTDWNRGTNAWVVNANQAVELDPANPYSTINGVAIDGAAETDIQNEPRGAGNVAPPTMLANSDTSENANSSRYQKLTRDSGTNAGGPVNSGLLGHGAGPYIDNFSDFQIPEDEQGRRAAGASASLVQDWLNPFADGVTFRSGWQGPFYIPVGAFIHLSTDGFIITRNSHPDQKPAERTWKRADGTDSGLTGIRYRVGTATDGKIHIVNSLTAGLTSVNGTLTPAEYQLGPEFNGVLYFEGNVRVRGEIPTDVQLTLVSNKSIYIEGNIIKGQLVNDVVRTSGAPLVNGRLNRASRSSLMLMAKDYVTLNPTMFFGPAIETGVQSEKGGQGIGGYNPIKVAAPDGALTLGLDYPLDQTEPIFANRLPVPHTYFEFDPANPGTATGTGARPRTNLLVTHALEYTNPGPANAFIGMNVNPTVSANAQYFFETQNSLTNSAKLIWATINTPAPAPLFERIYGLGTESFQQSPKFETVTIPLISPTDSTNSIINNLSTQTFDGNNYALYMQGMNNLDVFLTQFGSQPSGNYLLARAAAVPMDIRVEASIYAEEGSFFVIPGDWFNPNPNDTRSQYEGRVTILSGSVSLLQARAQAAQERLENFGTTMYAPFYGEPIDVRINILGSVAENMPPPISQQAEWLKKWGWIPTKQAGIYNTGNGASRYIPYGHVSEWTKANPAARPFTPNLTITYDPILATGRVDSSVLLPPSAAANQASPYAMVRTTFVNGVYHQLPPMPRLPVSPTLAYFGEIK